MPHNQQLYIDGRWIDPVEPNSLAVIDPSTEGPFATISIGSKADVDRAVAALVGVIAVRDLLDMAS